MTQDNWYVLQGEKKVGPFRYGDILRHLQSGMLNSHHMVWAPHMKTWTPIGESMDFSSHTISSLINEPSLNLSFCRRSSPRIRIQAHVLVHNKLRMLHGTCNSISKGGAGMQLNGPWFVPGQEIVMNLQPIGTQDSFNIAAKILNRSHHTGKLNDNSSLYYCVEFRSLQAAGRKWLDVLFRNAN